MLLDRDDPPTAVFAACDELALGFIRGASDRGVGVPADVSVVGFDDQPAALVADLTTVRQDVRRLGSEGARRLLNPAAGEPSETLDELLPVELVRRSTTASAPTRG